jgi:hypothetical protein
MKNRSDRDFRLDFFRGFALMVIFIDHVPGNPLAKWTLNNFAFCDAADVFVLISGMSSYLAYGSRLERNGFAACTRAVGRRWSTIYGAHLLLVLLLWAAGTMAARHFPAGGYLQFLKLDWLAESPREAMVSALTLRYLPTFLDVLALYLVLLAAAPFFLALVKRDWRLALAVSASIYVIAWVSGLNLSEGKGAAGWHFNPFAWQFLYIIGMVWCHLGKHGGAALPWSRRWMFAALAVAILGAVTIGPWSTNILNFYPRTYLLPADKTFLAPQRVINVLALFYVVAFVVGPQARIFRSRIAAPVLSCGRHSLAVYGLGAVASYVGYVAVTESVDAPIVPATVNLVGILTLVTFAMILEWHRAGQHQVAPPAPMLSNPRPAA